MAAEPPLALYAHAQAYSAEISSDAACSTCKGCPGPDAPDSPCATWKCDRPVGDRTDWPMCPVGMTRVPAWVRLVDRFVAARITPLSGFPSTYTEWAYRGFVELHCALRAKEDHDAQSRERARRRGGPAPTTRTTAKRPPGIPKPLPRRAHGSV